MDNEGDLNARSFSEEQARQESRSQQTGSEQYSNGFSVYTVEHGRRTVINYHSRTPPRTPAHEVMKEELPPTYEDALRMEQQPTAETSNATRQVTIPRRNSSTP